jgi:hypothetical protein
MVCDRCFALNADARCPPAADRRYLRQTNRSLQRRENKFVHYQERLFRKQEKVAVAG